MGSCSRPLLVAEREGTAAGRGSESVSQTLLLAVVVVVALARDGVGGVGGVGSGMLGGGATVDAVTARASGGASGVSVSGVVHRQKTQSAGNSRMEQVEGCHQCMPATCLPARASVQ